MDTPKKQATRQKILDSAWALFVEQGFADTTTRQIAHKAEVATGTVFSHFPLKIDLLKVGLMTRIDTVLENAAKLDHSDTPTQRLLHYADHLYAFYLTHPDFSRELFRALLWQQKALAHHIAPFQAHLSIEQSPNHQAKTALMMDAYFMTLFQGLSEPISTKEAMLSRLADKLATIA
ncbi:MULTISPECIES: TetR/AcrR family transcriptional regulator [unclassified Salinivibrio]|uniref:TetR/AcrR family transcriptional regulator n=1 Tax=unclassified Salinivibrio TaxID=2636825 RepID=UPI0006145186|nr:MULTISPECIES: TetR/AcrR family transcriptional regulator [unclassified Salinivibrio]KKA45333.1 hypothetical protein WN56_05075 [Salinivibrio sp. KP-1]OOE76400.1 TetR family transcriptional regulator [Salinivibrio sp. ML290]OOE81300.1 TetR family transcriptional regulator [Salinivibrio sp. ML198]